MSVLTLPDFYIDNVINNNGKDKHRLIHSVLYKSEKIGNMKKNGVL